MIRFADHTQKQSSKSLQAIFRSNRDLFDNRITLEQLNYKLKNLSINIHSMSTLVAQIKRTMIGSNFPLQKYHKYSIRLMMLINHIFQHYGIDKFTFSKINKYIRMCNTEWQWLLKKTRQKVNTASINQIFIYKTHRNNYLYIMLKTHNTLLLKMLDRLLIKNYLNAKALKYLKQSNIKSFYQFIYSKIIKVLQEQDEQTGLKIMLINEFLKFILFYLNLCMKESQFEDVFTKFFQIILYVCKYVKKLQRQIKSHLIVETMILIRQGLNYYIAIFKKNKKNFIKIQQFKYIVEILAEKHEESSPQDSVTLYIQENSVPIRILLKILYSWKAVWRSKRQSKYVDELQEMKKMENKGRPQQLNEKKKGARSLFQKKASNNQPKLQVVKITKTINNLKRRSQTMKKLTQIKISHLQPTFQLKSIANQKSLHKAVLEQSFQKIDKMKLFKNYYINSTHKFNICKENEIKQLNIQDYSMNRPKKNKSLKMQNRIVLAKGTTMLYLNKREKKLKLQIKNTMRQIQ